MWGNQAINFPPPVALALKTAQKLYEMCSLRRGSYAHSKCVAD